MKKTIYIIFMICLFAPCAAQTSTVQDIRYEPATYVDTDDRQWVEDMLDKASRLPEDTNLPLFFARAMKGTPYVGHTLDRTDNEKLVINIREVDCTTFMEYVSALTRCTREGKKSFKDFAHMLGLIRYRGGKLSYENRLHYYQWWVSDNEAKGIVKEICTPDPPFSAVQTLKINYMSTNYESYDMLRNHPERVAALKNLEDSTNGTRVRYIPRSAVDNSSLLRETIKDGDIIAIVTDKKNLDTTHVGFAVWHDDGLHLLNASSIHKKVVEEPMTLRQYLQRKSSRIGIRVARIL